MNEPLVKPMDRLAKKKANVVRVWIALDSDLADNEARLKGELDIARIRYQASPTDPERMVEYDSAKNAHDEANKELRENAVQFVFQAIPRKKWEDLQDSHPATDRQREKLAKLGGDPRQMPWNADTFPQEAVYLSLVEPKFNSLSEFMDEIWENDAWNGAETTTLLEAALTANGTRRVVDLGKG